MMLWLFLVMKDEFPVSVVNMLAKMIVAPKVKMKVGDIMKSCSGHSLLLI